MTPSDIRVHHDTLSWPAPGEYELTANRVAFVVASYQREAVVIEHQSKLHDLEEQLEAKAHAEAMAIASANDVQGQLGDTLQQLADSEALSHKLESDLRHLSAANEDLKQKLQHAGKIAGDSLQQSDAAAREMELKDEELACLTAELESVNSKIAEAEACWADKQAALEQEIQSLKSDLEKREAKSSALQESQNQELISLRCKVSEMEGKCSDLEEELVSAKHASSTELIVRTGLESRLEAVKTQADSAQQELLLVRQKLQVRCPHAACSAPAFNI